MDASTGPEWYALVDARVVSATAGPADWTLLAHTTRGGPAHFSVQSICFLHPPPSTPPQPPAGARGLRPRRHCVFGERSALQALDGQSRPAAQPRLFFITAVAGRRARLEHSLRLHARNAADFGDSTTPGATCRAEGRRSDGPHVRTNGWVRWEEPVDFGLCLATFDDAHDYKAADLLGILQPTVPVHLVQMPGSFKKAPVRDQRAPFRPLGTPC